MFPISKKNPDEEIDKALNYYEYSSVKETLVTAAVIFVCIIVGAICLSLAIR